MVSDMGIYWFTHWLFNIAMENGPFIDYLLKMVIVYSYVK